MLSLLRLPSLLLSATLLLATLLATAASAQQGSLDTTFDGDGKAVVPFDWGGDYTDFAYDVATQLDSKIVVVGAAGLSAANYDFAIVRMNLDGSLDSGFGNGGKTGVAFDLGGDGSDAATAVAIQGDGKVVVAGVVQSPEGGMNSDFAVVRLTASGILDTTFGTGGKVVVPFDLGWHDFDQASDVLIQSDGKIVVVGTVMAGWFNRDFAAIRLTASGSLDSTFGTGGKVVVGLDQGQLPHDNCEAAALQPDGKILLAGSMGVGPADDRDFALVRLNTDGSLDSTFGYGGGWTSVYFDVVSGGRDAAYSVALDSSGRILVAGRAQTSISGDQAFAVARLKSSGFSDTTFGYFGKTTLAIPAGQGDDLAVGIGQAANGKIVVAGQTFVSAVDADFAVARLLADGSLDWGFGNGGVSLVAFDYGQNNADLATAMTLQLTGGIVVAGWAERASFHDYDFVVARLVGEPFFSLP